MRYLLFMLLLASVAPASAKDKLVACTAISDPLARLACYDRLAHRNIPSLKPSPVSTNSNGPAETETAIPEKPRPAPNASEFEKTFGLKGADVDRGDQISAKLKQVHKNQRRLYVFTLDNGQVWMQREPGDRPIRAGQSVTITRERWSYSLHLLKQHFEVTVQRIR